MIDDDKLTISYKFIDFFYIEFILRNFWGGYCISTSAFFNRMYHCNLIVMCNFYHLYLCFVLV